MAGFDYVTSGNPNGLMQPPSSPSTAYDQTNDVLYCSIRPNSTQPARWSPINGFTGVNPQSGNYTALPNDSGKLLAFGIGATPATLTLPATPPTTTWSVFVQNTGSANLTVNRNGLLINGSASNLTVSGGTGTLVYTDGTNYYAIIGGSSGGGSVSSVFSRTGAVTAQTGDYTVAQVTGAAPTAAPTFTGTVTLPTTITVTGNNPSIVFTPGSGSAVNLTTGSSNNLNFKSAGNCTIEATSQLTLVSDANSLVLNDSGNGVSVAGIISSYDGTSTVNAGVPSLIASSSVTAQTAALSSVTIFAVPLSGAGLYRVNYRASVTTAGSSSSTLGGASGFQVIYTDANDSVVKTSNPTTPVISAGNTTGTTISGTLLAKCAASTNLQYSFGYTSNSASSMHYDLDVYVEYLG